MQSLIIGAVAIILGVIVGYVLGRCSATAESALLRDRVERLEKEKDSSAAASRELQESLTQLTGKLAAAEANVAAEAAKYIQMKADIETVFGDVAARALSANNQSFMDLARLELGGKNEAAEKNLAAKELAIKNLVDPLGEALKNLDKQAQEMESRRAGAYAEVKTLVENIQTSIPASLDALKNETAQLITALRAPKTRGNWGELQLKRCVEYAGMVQYCSFSEQTTARSDEDKMLRPDMTIQLPNGREIVVDAKTPLDAFLDASGSADPAAQRLRFDAHALRVRTHLKELSGKAYWRQFEKAPDFVVCFLPSEALFSAALEADPSLIEFGARNNVVMATPTTLIALLRAVEFGWQQSEITKNAKAIHETGRKIYDRLVAAQGHVEKLGDSLRKGVDWYNKFLGSVEGKGGVFFHGRRLGELVHGEEDLDEINQLVPEVREMESAEWSLPLLAIAAVDSEGEAEED